MSTPGFFMISINQILNIDCRTGLTNLPDNCVDCIVTSPPYYGLRDYDHGDQIGLEQTPEEYVDNLLQVFTECHRVLKPEGTLWLNLGDSYNGYPGNVTKGGKLSGANQLARHIKPSGYGLQDKNLKPKDLIGIPWMVAFALRSVGWYLRQDIIWHKPNPMPESVTDRCTKAHEYIFLLSKSRKYYYDHKAIMVDAKNPEDDIRRMMQQSADNKSMPDEKKNGLRPKSWNGSSFDTGKTGEMKHTHGGRRSGNKDRKPATDRGCPKDGVSGSVPWEGAKANKRSVWSVTTKPFSEAHFATFPEDLIIDCIKAGCPEGGMVLDPFMGAGTTAVVSRKLNRNFIGFELNQEFIKITEKRLKNSLGLFL